MIDLFVDFETYYDKDYSLSKMPTMQYIRDPRFAVLGASVGFRDGNMKWLVGDDLCNFFDKLPWGKINFVAHNAQFDGAVLTETFKHYPARYSDTMAMATYLISQGIFGSEQRTSLKDLAPLVGREKGDLDKALAGEDGGLETYALEDGYICRDLYYGFLKLDIPQDELDYIDLHVKMAAEPVIELDIPSLYEIQARDDSLVPMFSAARKDSKFAEALEALGVTPEYKTTPKGNMKLALSKTDTFMQGLHKHRDPRVRKLAELRAKAYSTNERTRAQRFIDIGAPLPVPLKYYGAHCVPGDTEVLTPEGWERLDRWQGGEIVQVREDGGAMFKHATRYEGLIVDEWLECSAPYIQCEFTGGHTFPRMDPNKEGFRPYKAEQIAALSYAATPVGARLEGEGSITPEQMRVLVMVQADGAWETKSSNGRGLHIFGKKPRKVERAPLLLAAAGVKFRRNTFPSHPGFVRFSVSWADLPPWLSPDRKQFGSWLLDSTPSAMEAFCDELHRWDGWVQANKRYYCTSNRTCAEWAQTMLHLGGLSGNIIERVPRRPNQSTNYVVGIRDRDYTTTYRKHWRTSDPKKAWCVETQTGYWLARSAAGHIFVTGNTGRSSGQDKINPQNLPRKGGLRETLLAPEGHVFIVVDSAQVEVRVLAWLAGQEDLLQQFRGGMDPYVAFGAKHLYHRDYDEMLAAYKAGCPVATAQRQVAKAAVLALGFGQGAQGFVNYCDNFNIPMDLVQAEPIVAAYRAAFPAISGGRRIGGLWKKCENEVRRHGYQRLPSGRLLTYPDLRLNGRNMEYRRASIFRKVKVEGHTNLWHGLLAENLTQAAARDAVFWQGLQLSKQYRTVLMVHDECVLCVPEDRAEQARLDAEKWFSTPPPWAPDMPLSGEAAIKKAYTK